MLLKFYQLNQEKQPKHQIVIRRLLSGYTQFDALLLVHEMGTGKTCSAIQAIEQNLIESNNGLFLRAVQTTEGIDDLILIKTVIIIMDRDLMGLLF